MKRKKIVITVTCTLLSIMMNSIFVTAIASDLQKPEIGKQIPDYVFTNVTHYNSQTVSISSFRGKWLFLDFWSNGCAGCVKSFPKASRLQIEFRDQLNWVLVGQNDLDYQTDTKAIERFYEKMRSKQGFELISTYDSVLFDRWDIPFVSYLYVIDPEGIVRYITEPQYVSSQGIRDILDGKAVNLFDDSKGRGHMEPQSLYTNGETIRRSILTKWNNEWPGTVSIDDFAGWGDKSNGYLLIKCPLSELYNAAYFGKTDCRSIIDSFYGKIYSYPVLELKDTTLFENDWAMGKGVYNYNLLIPPALATRENIMAQMQDELRRVFGYRVKIIERKLPVWKLIAKGSAAKELKSKGGTHYNSAIERVSAAGFWVRNETMKNFLSTLASYLSNSERAPFIDATGIESNIDILIDADLTNFEDVRRALNKHGLDIIRGVRKMKVLLIQDQKK